MGYFLYNLASVFLFVLLIIPYSVYCLLSEKYKTTFQQRLGFMSKEFYNSLQDRKVVWLYAGSVGEVQLAASLYEELRERFEDYHFLLSTSTHSGLQMAGEKFPEEVQITLLPHDFFWIMRKLCRKIQPEATVVVETNLWPNHVKYARRYGGSLLLINARFNQERLYDHFKIPGLLAETLKRFDLITLQRSEDYKKLNSYLEEDKLKITGNMKIDSLQAFQGENDDNSLKEDLNFLGNNRLLVAGSTHAGEEKIVLKSFNKLKSRFSDLSLVIAPRQIERSEEIRDICREEGLKPILRTELTDGPKIFEKDLNNLDNCVVILDTLGELQTVYSLADAAFVGGSLVEVGGHNLLEPLVFKCPVLYGPHNEDFEEIAALIDKYEAGCEITNEEELTEALSLVLDDTDRRRKVKNGAEKMLSEQGGAMSKNIKFLNKWL